MRFMQQLRTNDLINWISPYTNLFVKNGKFNFWIFNWGKLNFSNRTPEYICNRTGFKKKLYLHDNKYLCIFRRTANFPWIFVYQVFSFVSWKVEIFLNVILVLFLLRFIWGKFKELNISYNIENINRPQNLKTVILKTLGFTYLNPHVYSDTVFILGNLSKNFLLKEKIFFALGASAASVLFFYCLGYMTGLSAKFISGKYTWKCINIFIILFMTALVVYIIYGTFSHAFLL